MSRKQPAVLVPRHVGKERKPVKTCPYCAEEIQDAAAKCRYCGEWLKPEVKPVEQGTPKTLAAMVRSGEIRPDPRQIQEWGGSHGRILEAIHNEFKREPLLLVWKSFLESCLVVSASHLAIIHMVNMARQATMMRHDSVQGIQASKVGDAIKLRLAAIDLSGSPVVAPMNEIVLDNDPLRQPYAIALMSLIRPIQGIDPNNQRQLIDSRLGTAAAVAGGVLLGEAAFAALAGPESITTTIESVATMTDGAGGVIELASTDVITSEASGGVADFLGGLFS